MVLVGGALSAALLGASTTGTLSAFVASIQNSNDVAGSGVLTMQETSGAQTCSSNDGTTASVSSTSSVSCSAINKYGNNTAMVPASSTNNTSSSPNAVATTVVIKDTGTAAPGSFTLTPGSCTTTAGAVHGSATDICPKLNVEIKQSTTAQAATVLYSGTLTALYAHGAFSTSTSPALLNPGLGGAGTTFVFTVWLDASADNTYQGLSASQPLTWTFNS